MNRMTIRIDDGEIEVRDDGPRTGPTLVFVHGALVDGALWKDVVPTLAASHRCVVPDWPMGAHRTPMRAGADLSPPGMARVIAALLDALDLRDVTLVGNDTGGAICQILCAQRPARVARLVLTNCDALEIFPPREFAYLRTVQRVPGLPWLAAQVMRASARQRRARRAYGGLTARPVDDALLRAWVEPIARSRAIRRDLKKLVLGMRAEHTLAAASRGWDVPTLLAWGADDPFFPPSLGERLAAQVGARLEPIAGASTFVPLDQPARLAASIARFVASAPAARAMR